MKDIRIQNNKGLLKIRLNDINDKPILNNKGEEVFWTFDIEDIEQVAIWSDIVETDKKLRKKLQNDLLVIEKRTDTKGKYSNSKNSEDSLEVYREFFNKEIININRFLGENGVQKFLNGRKPYFSMFEDIAEAIEQILPLFDKAIEDTKARVKDKYSKQDDTVLE